MSSLSIRHFVITVFALFWASQMLAQEQVILLDSVPSGTPQDTEVQLDVVYSTANPVNENLMGLGLRLHWDSSELSFMGLSDVHSPDLLAEGEPEPDLFNFDGDSATDTFIHLAWTDLDGGWPGLGATPTRLYTAVFQTSQTFSGSTQVFVTASSTTEGYELRSRESSFLFGDGFESADLSAWTSSTGSSVPLGGPGGSGDGTGPAMTDLLVQLAGGQETLTELDFPVLDIDGDGNLSGMTDGLLVLRYLFGFTGDALVDGAMAAGATRTSAAEIEGFFADIEPALDVDLDGRRDALTDGVLVMRFLFGFQGSALTDGALGAGASRTDPQEISDYFGVLSDPTGMSDSDGDGVADIDELVGLEILIDLDGLGVCCLTSRVVTSDPFVVDTDGDGLNDFSERFFRTDPRSADTDLDGLDDSVELDRYASAPGSVDTDGDSRGPDGTGVPSPMFFDGNELEIFGTSPALEDTDGDARTDFEEANQNATPPLVADVPRLAVELVGDVNIDLEYTSTITSATRKLESTLVGQTDTAGQSSTDTNSSRWAIGASATVTVGASTGLPGGASASGEVSATISGEYSEETTTAFTEESSSSVQNEFQESQETSLTESQAITGGTLGTGINIRNLGDVAFTLSDLGITALLQDPDDRQSFKTVATLIPQIPAGGFTLGPFNGETGVLEVADPDISTALATSLLADPSGLHLDVATFSLEDAQGRNFAFLAEVTNARTAQLTVDFGNGDVERYRVATMVERNPNGTGAGITMEKILTDILDIPFETMARQGSTNPEFPDDVELLTQVRGIATNIETDPALFQNSFWAVLSSDPDLTGAAGVPFTTDFQDITLFSGDTISLTFVTDKDRDNLFLREEFLYGTSDEPRDFNGDGTIDPAEEARTIDFDEDELTDFVEVRTGWMVNVNGLLERLVHPDPTRPDTDLFDVDGDGQSDGDNLTDLEEFRGRDGCGPYDPADPDLPDPMCGAGSDSGDATDPTTSDTDRDGLADDVDDDPLDSLNTPPVITLTPLFDGTSGNLTLTGTVVDATDEIDDVIIDWGDGNSTCLANDGAGPCMNVDFNAIDVTHQYLTAGSYEVVVTASDTRLPPGVPSSSEVMFGPFEVIFPGDEEAKYFFTGGLLTDLTANGHDGSIVGTNSTFATITVDRFNNAADAYCLRTNQVDECASIELDHFAFGSQFTMAAWILRDRPAGMIVGQWDNGDEEFARLFFFNNKVRFEIDDGTNQAAVDDPNAPPQQDAGDAGQCTTSSNLADWTFYAATVSYDGTDTTISLWRGSGTDAVVTLVDQQVVANVQFVNPNQTDTAQIGGSDIGDPDDCDAAYQGRIDDVRFYDRALGAPELNALLTEVRNP